MGTPPATGVLVCLYTSTASTLFKLSPSDQLNLTCTSYCTHFSNLPAQPQNPSYTTVVANAIYLLSWHHVAN